MLLSTNQQDAKYLRGFGRTPGTIARSRYPLPQVEDVSPTLQLLPWHISGPGNPNASLIEENPQWTFSELFRPAPSMDRFKNGPLHQRNFVNLVFLTGI
jgi:hypothetical protein